MMKKEINSIWKALIVYSFIILIIIGMALIIITTFKLIDLSEEWYKFLHTLGISVFIGGILSSILKTLRLFKFFQYELCEVIYSDDFLKKRADLNRIWKTVSKLLYKKKFPEIGDTLEDIITEKYFPTKQKYYYHDYVLDGDIKILDETDQFIELTEQINLYIVANCEKDKVNFKFRRIIPLLDENDKRTSFELISLVIDDVQSKNKGTIKNDSNEERLFYEYKSEDLKGKTKYKIELITKKIYSLKTNPVKVFRSLFIINGLEITLRFPKESNLRFEFNSSGTAKKFESKNKLKNNVLKEEHEGLILPKQGYQIAMNFK